MKGKLIGKVTHYYDKIGVAIIELTDKLQVGNKVTFVKGEEELDQAIDSIQIEKASVDEADKGAIVGVKIDSPVKEGSEVYLK